MARFADLSAEQLSRHATTAGRSKEGFRLVYQALVKDPYQGEALRLLVDFLNQRPTEQFSAIVLEYALSPGSRIGAEDRRILDQQKFLCLWTWGFSTHRSGATELGPETFLERAEFEIDDRRYQRFIQDLIQEVGSLKKAFRVALTIAGIAAGFLAHGKYGGEAASREVLHPERFAALAAYEAWLNSEAPEVLAHSS